MKNNYKQKLKSMKTKFTTLDKISKQLIAFAFFAAFSLISVLGVGQTSDTYSTAGTYSWTCPEGVTRITVECWGAGGGGGVIGNSGGGGGGGGAYAKTTNITVVPGNSYTIVVGPGGAADVAAGGGIRTSFNGTTVIADYGRGTTNATGAVGGTNANSTGDTECAGGTGGNGNTNGDVGGGGGGCAGLSGNGNAGSNGVAFSVGGNGGSGNAGSGGAGGAGGNGTAGVAGSSHSTGGGGGGGGDNGLGGAAAGAPGGGGGGGETSGGAGADGQVKITYDLTVVTNPSNQSICYNSSADFNVVVSGISPFTYQWKYQGSNVANGTPAGAVYSGANTPTLTVSGAIANGTYSSYTCYITNAYGNVTSAGANLIVSATNAPDAPTDLTKSDDMNCSGVSITLGATVSSGVLEWYSGSCSGASETSPVTPTETTTYYAKAYDSGTGCRSACSEIIVYVLDDIEIIEQPESQYGCAGESLTFSVVATGAGITYQWQEDDGGGFYDLPESGIYSGTETMDLVISDVSGLDTYQYRCVVTGTCNVENSTAATLNEISTGLSGTKTVGTAGDYSTLKAAFDAINANGLSGDLFLQVISDVTETAEASLNEWVDCAGNTGYTVTVYPTGATRTISGNIATSLVTLNGADNVTFDGRLDMSGTANSLVLTNSNTSGATLKFINDASNNDIQYCTLRGASTVSTGVVFFSTATTTGNDNNTIFECDIRDAATAPVYGVYASGTAGMDNNDNTISNCNIYNFFNTGSICRGVHLGAGNTRWVIAENSFYQTASRTDATFYGISIINSSGGEFVIEGNFIGGTQAECGGSKMTYANSSYGISFEGIIIISNSVGVSLVKDNVVKNISFLSQPITASTQLPIFTAIDIYDGRIDVIGNIVGDESTNSIDVTINDYLTKTAWNNGVYHAGEGNIIGNEIGSITFAGNIVDQCGFNAIEYVGDMITDQIIADNVIGHPTTANSISFASGATPAMTMGGIYFGTAGNFETTVANNIIANITIGTTTTSCFFMGLNNQATAGSQIIKGNQIYNISSASARTGYYTTSTDFAALTGIRTNNVAAGANLYINNNSIYNISSTNASANYKIIGIFANIATSGTHIMDGNFIHSLISANTSTGVWVEGIWINSGTVTLSNNMIRLGIGGINTNNYIAGIEMQSTSANSVLFNSVYIGGTATGTQGTMAYYRSSTGTTNIRNNIFVNARTGGGATHYAYYLAGTANLTSNYNIYSNNAGGVSAYAGALRTTLAGIQTGTGQDGSSQVANPLYVNPNGAGVACDLHINLGSPAIGAAVTGTGVTTDFDGQERVAAGPCIGADENVTAPYGTDVFGIYSPDGINGNIIDCEIVSQGGAPGGTGYNVADPNEAYWPNVNISGYQVVTASNISCTDSDLSFTTADASPDWLFGSGSSPTSAAVSPTTSFYSSLGYKDMIESVKVYNDFNNITMFAPDPGVILGAPSGAGCPTTYTYTSSEAGSAGYLYEWVVYPPSGCQAAVANSTSSSTDITFINQTGVDQVFLVTLTIETECCGKLRTIERYITIYPGPVMPVVDGGPFSTCTGGEQFVSVLSPDPSYSYEWFDAETGGTQLGSGTSYTFSPMPSGTNYYYVQSTNSFGCSSQRTEIEILGDDPDAPTVDGTTTCGANDVTLTIDSPQAGYIYIWRESSCTGSILQAGLGTSFTYNVTATTTFYVSAIPPGCDTSTCATPVVTYAVPTDPISWQGDDATNPNDWFVAENWQNNCIPTCATNVLIPGSLSDYPEIGFDPNQVAEAHDLDLQSGTSITFTDNKAILQICGDFTHSGSIVTNDFGAVQFTGTESQTYNLNSGTGEFNNVKVDNTAATPSLTISGGDLILSAKGVFLFVNGYVVTGTNKLVLKNTASTAMGGYDGDRYVVGNLRRYITSSVSDYDLPVGVTDRYALANIKNSGITGTSYLDAKFLTTFGNSGVLDPAKAFDGTLRYDYVANEGIWQIDADVAPTGGSYDISLWFNDGGSGTFANLADTEFAPVKRVSSSTSAADWTALGGTHTATAVSDGYAFRSGWTNFSHFAVAYKYTPLPIELLSFEAECEDNGVLVTWKTSAEMNSHYFIVEISEDMRTFIESARVNASGNSNSVKSYNLQINVNPNVTTYLRLKQVDYDGTTRVVETIAISCDDLLKDQYVIVYPNPFIDEFFVVAENLIDEKVSIEIVDELGKLVYTNIYYPYGGKLFTSISGEKLAPGMYHIRLVTESEILNEKIIKK